MGSRPARLTNRMRCAASRSHRKRFMAAAADGNDGFKPGHTCEPKAALAHVSAPPVPREAALPLHFLLGLSCRQASRTTGRRGSQEAVCFLTPAPKKVQRVGMKQEEEHEGDRKTRGFDVTDGKKEHFV
ncbi:uncharacterized protein V6R79_008333 [Siganus canaliculatus]